MSQDDQIAAAATLLFDDAFREELQAKGRAQFERVISENADLFKQDLDATIEHINTELRQHVTRQLDAQFEEINKTSADLRSHITARFDEQFAQFDQSMEKAQELALDALNRSASALEQQHKQLGASLEKSIANQDAMFASASQENKGHLEEMKASQEAALATLESGAQAIEEQHRKLGELLEKGITEEKDLLTDAFEQNMARIIEHYLLGALGDQYDLKAQLPAIIKQMEENKQAIVDDMKL